MAVLTGNAPILREIESLKKIVEEAKEAALAAKSAAEDAKKGTIYINTEDDKIINLDHYCSIEVDRPLRATRCKLIAVLPTTTKTERDRNETIATFKNEIDAHYSRSHLLKAIADSKPLWDVNTVKSLSEAWCKVKEDNPSMDFLSKIEIISVSGLGEITIAYPIIYQGTGTLGDKKKEVETLLINVLDEHIKFKWEASE